MPEIDDLRRLVPQIQEPSLEAIVSAARRRRRVALALGAGTGAATLALGGILATANVDRAAPPVGPASRSEQSVRADGTELVTSAVSPDDSDVRIALWHTKGRSTLALTDDGFATSTSITSPLPVLLPAGGRDDSTRGPRIDALPYGDFLLVDTEAPQEWIVGIDGTVTKVSRTDTTIAPEDPGLWFKCLPAHRPRIWEDASPPIDPVSMFPWCALDPTRGTAYEWPTVWNGSVPLPVDGVAPWGVDNRGQPTFAWWESDGERHTEELHDSPLVGRGPVWGSREPTFFVANNPIGELRVLSPGPDKSLEPVSRSYPEDDATLRLDVLIAAPDGSLLAVESYPRTRIWRADDLTEGGFTLVHEYASSAPMQVAWSHEPVVADDHIDVWSPWGPLRSEDNGRTWKEMTARR